MGVHASHSTTSTVRARSPIIVHLTRTNYPHCSFHMREKKRLEDEVADLRDDTDRRVAAATTSKENAVCWPPRRSFRIYHALPALPRSALPTLQCTQCEMLDAHWSCDDWLGCRRSMRGQSRTTSRRPSSNCRAAVFQLTKRKRTCGRRRCTSASSPTRRRWCWANSTERSLRTMRSRHR